MIDEKQSTKGDSQEATTPDKDGGNKSQGSELIERARQEREGLVKENERLERNIKELRELEASRLLGGTAGGRVEPTPKKETAKEYKDRVMSGRA
jgi:hypothetical protein